MRTYGELHFRPDSGVGPIFGINRLEPHACIKLKALFPRIPKAKAGVFTLSGTPEIALDLEWFMKRFPLVSIAGAVESACDMAESRRATLLQAERILAPDYAPAQYTITGELRPYQAQGVDLWKQVKRLLIGDDVGLGKTLIGIGGMTIPELLPMAVVVQTHLPTQWRQSIHRFIPFGLRTHAVQTTKPYTLPADADVVVFRYSQLVGWVDVLAQPYFKSVVFDEIQELRRSDSQKYQAARSLARSAPYCLGLSATPIYNKGAEIYNVIDLLNPGALGSLDEFMREWTTGHDIVSNPKALGSFLRENHFFLRRTREEVGMQLPPVNRIVHTVGHDEAKMESVMDLAKSLAMRITTSADFLERGQSARELDMMMRQITGISKAKEVALYARILLENGEKVLLAGWHREVYKVWLEELDEFKPVMYTGSESGAGKERSKEDFINGDSRVMFISLRSGIGLDGLQGACSTVIFGELDWSPAVHEQVIGRLYRDGQENPVTAIFLVSDGGSDPVIVDLLGLKASQARGIVDPLAEVERVHSDESRIKALARSLIERKRAHLKVVEGAEVRP